MVLEENLSKYVAWLILMLSQNAHTCTYRTNWWYHTHNWTRLACTHVFPQTFSFICRVLPFHKMMLNCVCNKSPLSCFSTFLLQHSVTVTLSQQPKPQPLSPSITSPLYPHVETVIGVYSQKFFPPISSRWNWKCLSFSFLPSCTPISPTTDWFPLCTGFAFFPFSGQSAGNRLLTVILGTLEVFLVLHGLNTGPLRHARPQPGERNSDGISVIVPRKNAEIFHLKWLIFLVRPISVLPKAKDKASKDYTPLCWALFCII